LGDTTGAFGRAILKDNASTASTGLNNVKVAYAKHPDWQVSSIKCYPEQEFYTHSAQPD